MKNVMEHKGFYGTVQYSGADECLIGHIIGISDSVSYEGKNVDDVQYDFKDAVEQYIVVCDELGKKPLKSAKGSFNVRINRETHLKALIKADAENKTLNQVVKEAVEKEVGEVSIP